MRSTTFIRVLYYFAAFLVFAALIVQLISVVGFDLTSLLPPPDQISESGAPEAYFMLPILAACAPLGIILLLCGRLSAEGLSHSEPGVKNLLGISWVYAALNMANAAIRLHGGSIDTTAGQHFLNSGGSSTLLSSVEYHRDMALMMSYFMSWSMTVTLLLAVTYRDWLRELNEPAPPKI